MSDLKPAKAAVMAHEGVVHGKPITGKQRRYFQWVAHGKKKPMKKRVTLRETM